MNSEKPPHEKDAKPGFPEDAYQELWRELGAMATPELLPRTVRRIRKRLVKPNREQARRFLFRPPKSGLAWAFFSMVLLAVGWFTGYTQGRSGTKPDGDADRLARLESQVDALHEGLTLTRLASSSPFQRLQGIWSVGQQPTSATKSAVFEAMWTDTEVEVRLAAAQVLGSLGFDPEMAGRIETVLLEEPSALVQLRVLGYLAEAETVERDRILERLLQRRTLAPMVRDRIREIQKRKL